MILWGEPACWRLEAVGESEERISAGGEGGAGGFARLAGNELGLVESAVHENRVPPRMNGNRLDQVKLTNFGVVNPAKVHARAKRDS